MSFIRLENISLIRNGNPILKDISWSAEKNENWIILGPNGSGKSSLVSIMTALEWPTSGYAEIAGEILGNTIVQNLRKKIGLFEPSILDHSFSFHPNITVIEAISTGTDASMGVYRDYTAEFDRVRNLMHNSFQSSGFHIDENRLYSTLSSGEKRKILFLRILMSEPELMIFDEPFESLDIPSRAMLESIFLKFMDLYRIPNITILHRIEEIPSHATHALLLKNGRIYASGKIEEMIHSKNLSGLYETDLQIEKRSKRYICYLKET
ncbi:MAG: ATP-binding cassette domain-containing protein [Spirochaetia bacterium]|nr:ATP-binding cassette domain-containing protein [Spirochaetia bacterium]